VIRRVDEEDFVARGTLRDVKDTILDVDPGRARHDPNVAAQGGKSIVASWDTTGSDPGRVGNGWCFR
jgi:hypothetical protein